MSEQTTESGRALSAAERDYGPIFVEAWNDEWVDVSGERGPAWEHLSDGDRRRASTVANAVRDAVLADAPHQRAADFDALWSAIMDWVAAAGSLRLFDPGPESIPRYVAEADEKRQRVRTMLRDALAVPTDPRPVDPSTGAGQALDAAEEE